MVLRKRLGAGDATNPQRIHAPISSDFQQVTPAKLANQAGRRGTMLMGVNV
jgi:hypothetical protein